MLGSNFQWKDNDVDILIGLHGEMEPKIMKHDNLYFIAKCQIQIGVFLKVLDLLLSQGSSFSPLRGKKSLRELELGPQSPS